MKNIFKDLLGVLLYLTFTFVAFIIGLIVAILVTRLR